MATATAIGQIAGYDFEMSQVSMRCLTGALVFALALAAALAMPSVPAEAQTSTLSDQCTGGAQPRSYEEAISVVTCTTQLIYGDCTKWRNDDRISLCLKAKDYALRLGQTYLAMMHNAKSTTEKDTFLRMYITADDNGRDQFLATMERLNNLESRFIKQQGEFSPERLRALSPPSPPPPQVVIVPPPPVYQRPPSLNCISSRVGTFTYTDCQ